MVPSYLAFYAGGGFNGKLTEVGAWIGRGAFKEVLLIFNLASRLFKTYSLRLKHLIRFKRYNREMISKIG
jgi:hypothetical protein